MPVTRRSLAAVACVLLLLAVGARSNPRSGPSQLRKPAVISGHVYSAASGAPLADAKVVVAPCWIGGIPWSYTAVTAADGSYSVEVRPFCYILTASHAGYAPQDYGTVDSQSARSVNPHPGEQVSGIDFRLQPQAILSGTVYTPNHQPAAHVRVCAGRRSYSPVRKLEAGCERSTWTDADGHYRLDALSPGGYCIQAVFDIEAVPSTGPRPGWTYQDTYYPGTANVEKATLVKIASGKHTKGINFSLAAVRTYTVTAVVQSKLPGTDEDYYYHFTLDPYVGPERGGTDRVHVFERVPSGRYRITVLAQRRVRDVPEPPGAGGGWRKIRVTDADVHATIPVSKSGAIHVQVVIEPARALTRPVKITLDPVFWPKREMIELAHTIRTPQAFDFDPVLPNSYRLWVFGVRPRLYLKQIRCGGRVVAHEPFPVRPGAHVTCRIALGTDPATISGQVTENGKPAAEVSVLLAHPSASQRKRYAYVGIARTDKEGRYLMRGVAPGRYLLLVAPEDRNDSFLAPGFIREHEAEAKKITVTPDATLAINLELQP